MDENEKKKECEKCDELETYFSEEKIKIPETETVSFSFPKFNLIN